MPKNTLFVTTHFGFVDFKTYFFALDLNQNPVRVFHKAGASIYCVCFQRRSAHWQPKGFLRGSLVSACVWLLFYSTERDALRGETRLKAKHNIYFLLSLTRSVRTAPFRLKRSGLGNLAHYFASSCPAFLTHTIHSCVAPRCDKALLACCSCKLPPWLDERERPRDTERGRRERVEKPYKASWSSPTATAGVHVPLRGWH